VNTTSAVTLNAVIVSASASPTPTSCRRTTPAARRAPHGEQVLDDQPSDGDVTRRRVEVVVVGENPDQHDRAGDRERDPEHQAGRPTPPEHRRRGRAEQRRDDALRDRARHGDAPNREQLLDVELQADAKHQKDDADLGQLLGEPRIGDEAGRIRSDEQAADQIPDDRRQAETLGDVAEQQRRREAAGERPDQIDAVHAANCDVVRPR
jgi:hypothetical protein